MSIQKIIRAWKDESYRESLNDVELAMLPENPAGLVELSDEQLDGVAAGTINSGVAWLSPVCVII